MLIALFYRGKSWTLRLLLVCLCSCTPIFAHAASSVALAWDPSPNPEVTGYNVYYGVVSGSYTNMVSAGNATAATISGLLDGMTYYFAATATDGTGLESEYSNEASYSIPGVISSQPPTLDALADLLLNENAGAQTINLAGITSGSTNGGATLSVTASSGNPSLVPHPTVSYVSPNTSGSLSFTPVPFANGSTTVTVTVNNGGTSSNLITRSFTVTVSPVNQAPTLNTLPNLTLNEGSGAQTVNLAGITSGAGNEAQTLTVTATSGNTALVPHPTVSYLSPNATGSLSFTPVAFASGSATITVTVSDGGASNNIVTRSFPVAVSPVNQAPTLNPLSNLTINENAGLQTVNLAGITSGAANESQTLMVTASSSNSGLIPNPTVSYVSPNNAGSISFTPLPNAHGQAVLTVTVSDGGASNNFLNRPFTVTVNQRPTLSAIPNLVTTASTATPALPFTVGDAETAVASLTLAGTSSNLALVQNAGIVFGGAGAIRTVTVTPVPGKSGIVNITLTVSDGLATASTTFQLSIKPAPPGNFHVAGQ